jgi:hypothetical protein
MRKACLFHSYDEGKEWLSHSCDEGKEWLFHSAILEKNAV